MLPRSENLQVATTYGCSTLYLFRNLIIIVGVEEPSDVGSSKDCTRLYSYVSTTAISIGAVAYIAGSTTTGIFQPIMHLLREVVKNIETSDLLSVAGSSGLLSSFIPAMDLLSTHHFTA
jgi:Na+/H+ antiporter NhaD/arsenite permease-like protein